MSFSTAQLLWRNVSTIDSLSMKTKVFQLAIHDPNPPIPTLPATPDSNPYKPSGTRVWLPPNPGPGEEQRCFVIVRTQQGENPWRLDSRYANFKEGLGGGFLSWFKFWGVPKPGTSGGEQGFYRWNPEIIARLKKEAGIPVEHTNEKVQGGP
jgi:palmitoyltransferase